MPTSAIPLKVTRLPNRRLLNVRGADRAAFLQGLISNDINLCTPRAGIHAALLTPQGKYLHDFLIYDRGDGFWLDTEADRADDLLQKLKTYKLRAKVMLDFEAADYAIWAAWNDDDAAVEIEDAVAVLALPDPRRAALGQRLILPVRQQPSVGTPVDFNAYDRHRILQAVPDGRRDLEIGKATLLESNFDRLNGVSWSKGCYMGQELTARMHYRALVKKRLYAVRIEGAAPPVGAIILYNAADVGTMRSSCGDVGLALLKTEIAEKASAGLICESAQLSVLK